MPVGLWNIILDKCSFFPYPIEFVIHEFQLYVATYSDQVERCWINKESIRKDSVIV
jgi:hypothetical protein